MIFACIDENDATSAAGSDDKIEKARFRQVATIPLERSLPEHSRQPMEQRYFSSNNISFFMLISSVLPLSLLSSYMLRLRYSVPHWLICATFYPYVSIYMWGTCHYWQITFWRLTKPTTHFLFQINYDLMLTRTFHVKRFGLIAAYLGWFRERQMPYQDCDDEIILADDTRRNIPRSILWGSPPPNVILFSAHFRQSLVWGHFIALALICIAFHLIFIFSLSSLPYTS